MKRDIGVFLEDILESIKWILERIWQTIKEDIIPFKTQIQHILKEVDQQTKA